VVRTGIIEVFSGPLCRRARESAPSSAFRHGSCEREHGQLLEGDTVKLDRRTRSPLGTLATRTRRCVAALALALATGGAACAATPAVPDAVGTIDASTVDASTVDAPPRDVPDTDAVPSDTITPAVDGAMPLATPGWNLVAVDTPRRTYVDYVQVPSSGVWRPERDGFPVLAQWEAQSSYSALRFQPFTPGGRLTPAQIMALLPIAARATRTISITDAPYRAPVAPADATSAIQAALDAAAAMATPGAPVDVLVPPGRFNYARVLTVGRDVRLRRAPEDSGGVLHATTVGQSAVHLAGDRSGALFLSLETDETARSTAPPGCGIWVGADNPGRPVTHDTLVVGNDIARPSGAHVAALSTEGNLWAFNYAHDGFADTFHHTGGSRFCQVVGNRAQTSATRGDDFYAFVGYQGDGDPVHHCTCIANWGRDGHARGLAAVGAGFIAFAHNDIDRTQWAGVYLTREASYNSYGTFDITVLGNTIQHANLGGSHDGLLAYADDPAAGAMSAAFGMISNQVRRLTIRGNAFNDTAAGVGNGFGIEIRASVAGGDVSGNTLARNRPPQLVINGTGVTSSANTVTP
jgi:hypothetical protein